MEKYSNTIALLTACVFLPVHMPQLAPISILYRHQPCDIATIPSQR